jgi:Domain of unknown function (DUF4149)
MKFLGTLGLVSVAAWLGIMTFFSFEVAPVVFKTIDRAIAGQAVTAVLPRYYRWGLALSGFALVASALQAISGKSGRLRPLLGTALAALMVTMLIWASAVLMPRAETARRTRDDAVFARTHRASIQINLVTLGAGVAFLILEGVSRRRDR